MPNAILPNGILNQTIAGVTDILGDDLDRIAVERGLWFSLQRRWGIGPGDQFRPRQ